MSRFPTNSPSIPRFLETPDGTVWGNAAYDETAWGVRPARGTPTEAAPAPGPAPTPRLETVDFEYVRLDIVMPPPSKPLENLQTGSSQPPVLPHQENEAPRTKRKRSRLPPPPDGCIIT